MAATTTPALLTLDAFRNAQTRIRGVAVHTPLVRLFIPGFDEAEVYVKAEGLQPIGSFKLRGAYNKIAQLTSDQRSRGVITYSCGNHAQGVAYAARAVGAKAVIVMPSNAPEVKKRATAALGAEIVEVGPASSDRKAKAEELESKYGYVMIPPYDDEQIIAGQGTCGLEILEDLPDVDLVLSPVSGGGLLSGVATAIKLSSDASASSALSPSSPADARKASARGSSSPGRPTGPPAPCATASAPKASASSTASTSAPTSTTSSPSPKPKSAPPCAPSSTPLASPPSPAVPAPPPVSCSTATNCSPSAKWWWS